MNTVLNVSSRDSVQRVVFPPEVVFAVVFMKITAIL